MSECNNNCSSCSEGSCPSRKSESMLEPLNELSKVKKVIGVELNKNAIMDAKINAKINNISNIEFIADDATNFMTHLAKDRQKIDVVIMDPPREGSTKQFINAIGYLKPKHVIYISCDPKTLKRDLYLFLENDYQINEINAVDMFSRTQHVETVCLLSLKEN